MTQQFHFMVSNLGKHFKICKRMPAIKVCEIIKKENKLNVHNGKRQNQLWYIHVIGN